MDDFEPVQKRTLSIISPTLSYTNVLPALDLESLMVHQKRLSQSFLHHLLPRIVHNTLSGMPELSMSNLKPTGLGIVLLNLNASW